MYEQLPVSLLAGVCYTHILEYTPTKSPWKLKSCDTLYSYNELTSDIVINLMWLRTHTLPIHALVIYVPAVSYNHIGIMYTDYIYSIIPLYCHFNKICLTVLLCHVTCIPEKQDSVFIA